MFVYVKKKGKEIHKEMERVEFSKFINARLTCECDLSMT